MINASSAWNSLVAHQHDAEQKSLRNYFSENVQRAQEFTWALDELSLDLSKNHLDAKVLELLNDLALEAKLPEAIQKLFSQQLQNNTEQRLVFHPALRDAKQTLHYENKETPDDIKHEFERMKNLIEKVRNEWKGVSGKSITDVVNIGIGGSDLGPRLIHHAFKHHNKHSIQCHFIANLDPEDFAQTTSSLNPETTLFIVTSKSFTTEETLSNFDLAMQWIAQHTQKNTEECIQHHCIAITTDASYASKYGIPEKHCLLFWDWVGGRYSLWSTAGFIIALHLGIDGFFELHRGAHAMDCHFRDTDLKNNIPVLLALNSMWYRNFWNTSTHAIIPYAERLQKLPAYLQQLEMESNGKRVDRNGNTLPYRTSPVIWGDIGTNGQHAFHQYLHQGCDLTPIDFIVIKNSDTVFKKTHQQLVNHAHAQANALMYGEEHKNEPHKTIPGNRPSTMITLEQLTPYTLGMLLALYEHKVFTQGIIWNINSFDQWGVALGKKLAQQLSHKET